MCSSLSYLCLIQAHSKPLRLLEAIKNVKGGGSVWGPQGWVALLPYLGDGNWAPLRVQEQRLGAGMLKTGSHHRA